MPTDVTRPPQTAIDHVPVPARTASAATEPTRPTRRQPVPLAERLADATTAERAMLIVEALADGQPLALPGADLRGLDLRPRQLARTWRRRRGNGREHTSGPIALDGANLAGATLSGAQLAGVSLRGVNLEGALLVGAQLRGADLVGASLRRAHLTGADLSRADLSHADLRGASLLTTDLRDATCTGADLRETLLNSARLPRAVLRGADLRWAHLDNASLAGADLSDVRFDGATLSMTNLVGAQLSPSTDFSYAFLHHARFEHTGLRRYHIAGGVGEVCADLAQARETYLELKRHFTTEGYMADARWAHRQAWRMETATHRPDRARRTHTVEWQQASGAPADSRGRSLLRCGARRLRLQPACFYMRHTMLWLLGHLASLATGYGTSFARITATIVLTWLLFGLSYLHMGAVIDFNGGPVGALSFLRYSAASLTPIDAYPLIATSEGVRLVATLEGVVGTVLFGALGYVTASRILRE